ncbi:hypothetical protein QJ850_gp395 [Acanthamoeba polyphaga mimivirus]|uniref:Uncharacterized protein n=1 Tax=Acanthamoeba polyphaga mimivirus Kroon TaxID=3069720 RepID=A0A0G2Y6U0_9VIRU|nr:hypothetical protein QJ850_gp395 [Acanthamoeba polyphaga mimivirus]AKI80304.1 hypothetical protein [Acanthamoeba polyphaga mimivirus Kroon]
MSNKLIDNSYLYGAEITDFNSLKIKGVLENGIITFPQINDENPLQKCPIVKNFILESKLLVN